MIRFWIYPKKRKIRFWISPPKCTLTSRIRQTANLRSKVKISQNRNRSKQFLYIKKLRETTNLGVETNYNEQ